MRADVLVAADAARLVGLRAAAGHRWKSPRGPAEEARLVVDHHLLPLLPLLAAPPRAEERPPAILLRLRLVARIFCWHPALWAALGSLWIDARKASGSNARFTSCTRTKYGLGFCLVAVRQGSEASERVAFSTGAPLSRGLSRSAQRLSAARRGSFYAAREPSTLLRAKDHDSKGSSARADELTRRAANPPSSPSKAARGARRGPSCRVTSDGGPSCLSPSSRRS